MYPSRIRYPAKQLDFRFLKIVIIEAGLSDPLPEDAGG
jgi:hypothetical protein